MCIQMVVEVATVDKIPSGNADGMMRVASQGQGPGIQQHLTPEKSNQKYRQSEEIQKDGILETKGRQSFNKSLTLSCAPERLKEYKLEKATMSGK